MAIALLTFGATFGGAALLFAWLVIHAYRLYREAQVVTCPQNGAPAAVKLYALRAAATQLTGKVDLRLSSCSRWPERSHCGQECVSQIKAAPRNCNVRSILAKSYLGARCALCRVDIGSIGRGEHKPVLMSPDRKTRIEWDEIPPQELPNVLSTHSKICWNCNMEESFRTLRPGLAAGDPSRGAARRSLAS